MQLVVDYHGLVEHLDLSTGWAAPTELASRGHPRSALTRDHLHDDVRGSNASLDLIRRTHGGSWPTEPVTENFNYVDLVWHECDSARATRAPTPCPTPRAPPRLLLPVSDGRRTPLTEELLAHDVDVSWWVTPDGYRRGYYTNLYSALRRWVCTAFPFSNPYCSNAELPSPDVD